MSENSIPPGQGPIPPPAAKIEAERREAVESPTSRVANDMERAACRPVPVRYSTPHRGGRK